MRVVGSARLRSENFNGVSDRLKQELIKPVKNGEIIYFKLLNGSWDVSLQREVFGASRSIVLKDTIRDPYAVNDKDEVVGAFVDIGVPTSIVKGIVERCGKYWVDSIANGIPGNGEFQLRAGSVEDMAIYEFLCLSNGNPDNPYRDETKAAKYQRQDIEAIANLQKEKDYKELQAKLKLFAKQNPKEAAKLSELIPKTKEASAPTA